MNKALFLSLVLVVAGVAAADVAVKGPDGRLEFRLGTENGAPQRGTVRSTSIRNPVIYADCPDPTMCRAGEYVYMVTTTMFFMPGAPVMRSKDMVHWETVSYIFDRFDFGPQYSLEDGKSAYGAGQWATSLVHHNGKFYAWFIANGSGGFVYVADRPEGPWKLLTRAPHLHDCSILFDDDGRVYGFHGSGRVTELEPDFSAVKKGGLDRQLFERGEETALLEGSAAFKKDGYYYLMMVSAYLPGHVRREVCYRSRSLTGEWEKKVILETEFESYGGVGQGCVVECPDGKWRAMVFQDRGGIGRVPCLMDVTWKDGWPMLGDAEGKIPNDVAKPYPDLSGIAGSDDFGAKSLSLLWQWNHNPLEGAWSLSERPGWLRLKARRPADNIFLARNTLTQRMVAPACFGEIKMDVSKMKNGDHAGLAAFQSDSALLSVVMENGSKRLVMSEQKSVFGNGRQIKNVETVERESVPLTSDVVYMRIRADFRQGQDWAEADWSTDGRSWRGIGARFPLRFDWQRLFVGSRFALFCYSPEPSGGSVDFDYFRLGRDDGADYEAVCGTSRGEVRVSSFSEGSLRVTRGRPVAPELVFDADRKAKIEVERGADATRVRSGDLVAVVSHATGLVRFEDARGRAVLSERRVGEKGVAFDSPSDERLCGLGQFQDGQLDVRNLPRRLTQVNTQISAPFLVSTRGWGLYWHNYSKIEFNECSDEIALIKTGDGKESEVVVTTGSGGAKEKRKGVVLEGTFELGADCECAFMLDCGRDMSRVQYVEIDGRGAVDNENVWLPPTIGFRSALRAGAHKVRVVANANDRTRLVFRPDKGETTFRSDVADGTDYVVYLGAPETAVAHFRADCGGTAALPDWAWGYWHCQERFVTQDDLLKAMRYFKDRGLPLSVIVQDWQWWRSGTWNSMEWDAKRFPDPKGMVDECHKNGVRVMLSVWSKTEGDSEFCRAMKDADAFVPGTPWIDFSKKSAADLYWKWFAERLVSTGVDAWWLDAVEPENDAMHGRTFAMGEGDRYRNIYPLLVNTEADRRMRELRPGETPLVLTRCAFPGQTRTSCVMWSGDVGSTWKDLRTQIVAGLGFASAGFPYWTSDAGGFFRPGDQHANSDYQKRLVRWLQFATFCPIQRIHGFVSDTTPSRYGERTEKLLNDQVRLRERLRPYILNFAKDVVGENAMMMRPLYEAPRGFETEYMFGPDLLVCPVTADVEEMDVWLPEGAWRDFHTGEEVRGGRVVRAKTPIDRIPVYVRAGAKIPNVPAKML